MSIAFAQHFAGRDMLVSVDGSALTARDLARPSVDDADAGASKGSIEVLSDALLPKAYRGDPLHMRLIHPGHQGDAPLPPAHQPVASGDQGPAVHPAGRAVDRPRSDLRPGLRGRCGRGDHLRPRQPRWPAPSRWTSGCAAGRPDLAALAISKASNGDQIFHCHLYPHFAQGFWAALRVFDRQRPLDGAPGGPTLPYAADLRRRHPDRAAGDAARLRPAAPPGRAPVR